MGFTWIRNILLLFIGLPSFAVLISKWKNVYALKKFKDIKTLDPA